MTPVNKHASISSLDGTTLAAMTTLLSGSMCWEAMGAAVPVRCFTHGPGIKSSLKFLRKTPWVRKKVEQLYLHQARHGANDCS